MPKVLRTSLVSLSICLFSSWANASTIVLDSGLMVMGKIIYRNATEITIDVEGSPETFFLGEIKSIDGQSIEIPQIKHQNLVGPGVYAAGGTKTIVVPYYEGEEDSLIKFMTILSRQNAPTKLSLVSNSLATKPAATLKSDTAKPQSKPITVALSSTKPSSLPATSAMPLAAADANKNILTTSDGGIIVVSQAKITKFDKDLNIIKQVSLNQPPQ